VNTGRLNVVVTQDSETLIILLIFTCGIVVGFGIFSLASSQHQPTIKHVIKTPHAPEPIGPYNQAVQYGDLVFISGQIGIEPVSGNLSETVDGQTVRIMENLRAVLDKAGLEFSDVVQTRIYLTDMSDWNTVNGIYGSYFEDKYPARATIVAAGLPKEAQVEIEMIAKRS